MIKQILNNELNLLLSYLKQAYIDIKPPDLVFQAINNKVTKISNAKEIEKYKTKTSRARELRKQINELYELTEKVKKNINAII